MARFVSPVSAPASAITRFAFRSRFTSAEKTAIELASLDVAAAPFATRAQSAALRVYMEDVSSTQWIDLLRTETRGGVQQLEALGLLAAGRAAVILDSAPQDAERPVLR